MNKKRRFKIVIGFIVILINNLTVEGGSFVKTFGGKEWDEARSISKTGDGGYIVAGWTYSFGAGYYDFLVIRLDSKGNIKWAKTFGGEYLDYASSIRETLDGGYIVAGWTYSFGAGYYDFLVIRLDSKGNIKWAKTFGGGFEDKAHSIYETADGGYIVAGHTNSFGKGNYDLLVIKLNSNGDIEWSKTFGGENNDYAYSIYHTTDGGYIVAGHTNSFGKGDYDFLVIKLNSNGDIEWTKTFGSGSNEYGYSICQTADGGYIVGGTSEPLFFEGAIKFLVIKLSSDGSVEWAKKFGIGESKNYAYSIQETGDDGYIIAGKTNFSWAGGYDFLVIKIQKSQMTHCYPWYDVNIAVNSPEISLSSPSISITKADLITTTPAISSKSSKIQVSNVCIRRK